MDQKNYTMGSQPVKADLKQSIQEAKENISHTVENITDELKETLDWQSWVRRYPTEFALGALALGFWIGRNFTPSATGNMSSEARRDISQIPNILGSMLAGLLTKKTTEFIEGLGRSITPGSGRAGTSSL